MSYKRESRFWRFLRTLFTAIAETDRELYGSAAAPPPLHVERGPATSRRDRKRR
jgi:hypothetical protein